MGNPSPYLGEIRLIAGGVAPWGWMFCDGAVLPIANNEALFSVLGTAYGGDGESTFALPDLRGRVPIHMGQGTGLSNYVLGENSGREQVLLFDVMLPAHTHSMTVS